VTRYSRESAEQLILAAQPVIAELLDLAATLADLQARDEMYGSEAAFTHVRLDATLAWFSDRHVRLDALDPVALALPARLVDGDEVCDVWLSWQDGEPRIGWYYPTHGDVTQRRWLSPDISV